MEPLHRATVLNNMGAHLFDVHNTLGAIQAFQEAIHTMKECRPTPTHTTMHHGSSGGGGRTRNNSSNNSMMLLFQSLHSIPSIVIDADLVPSTDTSSSVRSATMYRQSSDGPHKNRNIQDNGHYEYYIHNRTLTLPTPTTTTTSTPHHQHHISKRQKSTTHIDNVDLEVQIRNASIVILFNLAICSHQWGKHRGQTSTIQQALLVYEHVVQLIFQLLTPTTPGTFLRVLLCLTLNNMVSIHYDLCDYDNGLICIGYIQRMFLRHSDTMDTMALEFIPSREWNDIKLNALLIESPSAASAA